MPTFLSKTAVEAALAAATVIDDFDAGLHHFPYLRLSANDFELLLYALYRSDIENGTNLDYDDVRVLNEGADRGRDLVLYRQSAPIGVVQCKRHEASISLPEIL